MTIFIHHANCICPPDTPPPPPPSPPSPPPPPSPPSPPPPPPPSPPPPPPPAPPQCPSGFIFDPNIGLCCPIDWDGESACQCPIGTTECTRFGLVVICCGPGTICNGSFCVPEGGSGDGVGDGSVDPSPPSPPSPCTTTDDGFILCPPCPPGQTETRLLVRDDKGCIIDVVCGCDGGTVTA